MGERVDAERIKRNLAFTWTANDTQIMNDQGFIVANLEGSSHTPGQAEWLAMQIVREHNLLDGQGGIDEVARKLLRLTEMERALRAWLRFFDYGVEHRITLPLWEGLLVAEAEKRTAEALGISREDRNQARKLLPEPEFEAAMQAFLQTHPEEVRAAIMKGTNVTLGAKVAPLITNYIPYERPVMRSVGQEWVCYYCSGGEPGAAPPVKIEGMGFLDLEKGWTKERQEHDSTDEIRAHYMTAHNLLWPSDGIGWRANSKDQGMSENPDSDGIYRWPIVYKVYDVPRVARITLYVRER